MKRILLFLLLAVVPTVAIEHNQLVMSLVALKNMSQEQVSLGSKDPNPKLVARPFKMETVAGGEETVLRRKLIIPFVSIEQYIERYSRDNLYVPQEALLVKTSRGTFALWYDQTGVIAALRYEKGNASKDDCFPYKVYAIDDSNNSQLRQAISLLLLVNAKGEIAMQEAA